MVLNKPDHRITVLHHPHAFNIGHSNRLWGTFLVGPSGKLHRYRAARIFLPIASERLVQHLAVCFIELAQRVIRIENIIHLCMGFLLQVVVNVPRVNLNVLSIALRYMGVVSENFFAAIFISEKSCKIRKEYTTNRG